MDNKQRRLAQRRWLTQSEENLGSQPSCQEYLAVTLHANQQINVYRRVSYFWKAKPLKRLLGSRHRACKATSLLAAVRTSSEFVESVPVVVEGVIAGVRVVNEASKALTSSSEHKEGMIGAGRALAASPAHLTLRKNGWCINSANFVPSRVTGFLLSNCATIVGPLVLPLGQSLLLRQTSVCRAGQSLARSRFACTSQRGRRPRTVSTLCTQTALLREQTSYRSNEHLIDTRAIAPPIHRKSICVS